MKAIKSGGILALSSIILSMTSCISTHTMEPDDNSEPTKTVVLNLATSEEAGTRADNDHVLRYIAKLYLGTPQNIDKNTMMRKDLIAGTKGELGVENQIVFNIAPNQHYTILLFADYIPSSNADAGEGSKRDYYYDTSSSDTKFIMLPTPGNASSSKVTEKFFNNDNYDCFWGMVDNYKTEAKDEYNLKLSRAVAKVRLVDNSASNSGTYDISVSKVGFFNEIHVTDQGPACGGRGKYSENVGFSPLTIAQGKAIGNDGSDKEILYFYTFANDHEMPASPSNAFITCKVSDSEGNENEIEIRDNIISVVRNYITTVSGGFLPSVSEDPIGPEPTPNPDDTNGPIILNMDISNDWTKNTDVTGW